MTRAIQLAAAVRARAGDRCQYCLMDQNLQGASFHVEHITPRCAGGATELSNPCLSGFNPMQIEYPTGSVVNDWGYLSFSSALAFRRSSSSRRNRCAHSWEWSIRQPNPAKTNPPIAPAANINQPRCASPEPPTTPTENPATADATISKTATAFRSKATPESLIAASGATGIGAAGTMGAAASFAASSVNLFLRSSFSVSCFSRISTIRRPSSVNGVLQKTQYFFTNQRLLPQLGHFIN
jgi:hypothetical protein